MVASFEDDLPLNSFVVHEGAVRAPQVAQANRKVVDREDTMMATDKVAIGAKMTILFAPDEKLPDVQRNRFPLLPTLENLQFHLKHGDVISPAGHRPFFQIINLPSGSQTHSEAAQVADFNDF
jgi:hypothetical protein